MSDAVRGKQDGKHEMADEVEALAPVVENRPQTIGLGDGAATYTQKPLSYMGKLQLFALLGRAIDRSMAGEGGLSLDALLAPPRDEQGQLDPTRIMDADAFVVAIGKLAQHVPDLVLDLYCVFLAVPEGEREWAKATMQLPEDEGGLSDEDGLAVLETFVAQNAATIRAFFVERLLPLFERTRSQLGGDGSPQPKRSKRTPRSTRSG